MRVQDIMTTDPVCCASEASLREIARMMVDHDCGAIPVLDEQGRLAGVVTDRDITCRAVAEGRDPQATTAREVMSSPVVTATEDTSVEDCVGQMEQYQIRRMPVVDAAGNCRGIISQADIARLGSERDTAELVRDVSQSTGRASTMPPA